MLEFFRRQFGRQGMGAGAVDGEPENPGEVALIQGCRARFGPPPRTLSPFDAACCQIRLTPEVDASFRKVSHPLLRVLTDQAALRDRGQIVWGQLIQANRLLFDSANQHTLAAGIVYSVDPYFDGRVQLLRSIASGLFAQKGSVPKDAELREFVAAITSEQSPFIRRELPRAHCGNRSVFFGTCLFQPSHLPDNRLSSMSFPLLVNLQETEAVMVLPARFWPAALVSRWRSL
jgi:hypothetical protein